MGTARCQRMEEVLTTYKALENTPTGCDDWHGRSGPLPIRQPTMLVWGEDDVHIPLEQGFRLRDEMPNARLVVFRNCGHLPPQEYPKQFVGMVSEFCKTEEQKAAPLKVRTTKNA